MRRSIMAVTVRVLTCLWLVTLGLVMPVKGQGVEALQPGVSIEHPLAAGQSQGFSINLEKDQFLQLVVEQHGIDVIVRVFSPAGKNLGEFDSPNGKEGPENVAVVSEAAGVYRIDVAPLGQEVEAGRYQIKIVEVRPATDQELQAGKNDEVLKARGLALLSEVADSIAQLRVTQTRVRAQLQTAQLLWPTNEKLAAKLAAAAVEGVREFIAAAETSERDYYTTYSQAMQLREEVLRVLGPHDPEMALAFLRSTRTIPNPNGQNSQWDQELQLELSLANQIAARDPKTAFQIAHDSLKQGFPPNIVELIERLRAADPELAAQLGKDLAVKLMGEKLLKNQEAVNTLFGLLRLAHVPAQRSQPVSSAGSTAKADVPLLSEPDYKALFEKVLADGLSYNATAGSDYSPERSAAQNILANLNSAMANEMTAYAPGSVALIEKKIGEFNTAGGDSQGLSWQKHQEAVVNAASVDAALEEVGRAPQEMRESLYPWVAQKAAAAGDMARARQIAKDSISNPSQRQQVLSSFDQQAILADVSKGKFDEALRAVGNLRTARERALVLTQIAGQIGPGQKRTRALELLEQARSLLGAGPRVENQEQLGALLEIARACLRYDSRRAFEIIEPLVDQFNEMSSAALVLDGFGQEFYEGGELEMQNGNALANFANQLTQNLGVLAPANFDRAKAGADRIERLEVRITAYLAIAEQAIGPDENRRSHGAGRFGGRIVVRD